MKNRLIAAACIALLFIGGGVLGYRHLEAKYQAEMDEIRVRDIQGLASLVEQYRETVGALPLSQRGAALPAYVDLVPGGARAIFGDSEDVRRPGTEVPVEEFIAELRHALGPNIFVPRDPQRAPSGRPNFYQYQYNGDAAFVAASLASPRDGTRQVAPGYFKYELRIERAPAQ